jgi:hypothetical protein
MLEPNQVVNSARKDPHNFKLQLESFFDSIVSENFDRDTAVDKVKTAVTFLSKNDAKNVGYEIPEKKASREKEYPWAPTKARSSELTLSGIE